jgi:hypothetical protein
MGIILFLLVSFTGWLKLSYGVNFGDEGFHMAESWRLSAGDHFLKDKISGSISNYTLINGLIFRFFPKITLLDFRKLQFFLTIIAICIFGLALYSTNLLYWYIPYVFILPAFSGLDISGAISNLNYYTYPHFFLTLYISTFILGIYSKSYSAKRILLSISGVFLWAISFVLLHLSIIIIAPFFIYILSKNCNLKSFKFTKQNLLLSPSGNGRKTLAFRRRL